MTRVASISHVTQRMPAPRQGRAADLRGPVVTPRSKVRPPAPRSGQIRRTRLIAALEGSFSELVLVLAPAGFGKTILASQWAAQAGRPIGWATLTKTDGDPVVLMSTLLAALTATGATVLPRRAR